MARTPVLFIPGLTGSFNLPVLLDWRGPTLNGWGFPPFIDYGKGFLAAFERAGYVRDRDLFVAFYDWRKAVRDSAVNYLKPWIDRAKQRAGAKKVVLVGHSMGGLVARSYIQSKAYADDVERLITLGTPHRGAAESYYAWGGGTPKSDPSVQAVFDIYLWYLRHAHPFQTELDPLRTMRTQVPGLRDLLPIDNYLLNQGGPNVPKDENSLVERNLWGDLLNQPAGVETLLGRVPVTTFCGTDFSTIRTITVAGPPLPPGDPAAYPDGAPISDQMDGAGDGTVLRINARVDHARAENMDPLPVHHGALPDHPSILSKVFAEIGVNTPALTETLGSAPVEQTKLVIMTASPVTLEVRAPGGPPMVPADLLGGAAAEQPTRRARRMRARDHGHAGKHLNVVVIPDPPAGAYDVRLHGTATGTFALGAMIISAQGVQLLGGSGEGEGDAQPHPTPINTVHGQVAADTDLHFEVVCFTPDQMPTIRLDQAATGRNALAKLRVGLEDAGGGLLGGEGTDAVGAILGGADAPDELRDSAGAALAGDEQATDRVAAMLGGGQAPSMADLLSIVAERGLGAADEALALAIITQLAALK